MAHFDSLLKKKSQAKEMVWFASSWRC
jgi:hypothetical protein